MPYFTDRTWDTSTTTGTGAYTLSGSAPAGYQTFASALGSNTVGNVPYKADDGTNWEVGMGTFNGTTGLTRDRILASSNSGAAVNWVGNTINIWIDIPANAARTGSIGRAAANAWAQGWN